MRGGQLGWPAPRIMLWWASLLATSLAAGCKTDPPPQPTRVFGLYAVWFEGSNDGNRARVDTFLDCLLEGSNFNRFFRGEARVEPRGSWALPRPGRKLDRDELAEAWLLPAIDRGDLPAAPPDETPLYLVFGGHPDLWVGSCGRNGTVTVDGRTAGFGIVRNGAECWPVGDMLRTETQIAAHEIVETVDRVLGYGTCAAGGSCRGKAICEDRCDTFTGLQCPGAPTGTYTGCDGGRVDGWLVQKLTYAGRDRSRCDECAGCDFTIEACPPEAPDCGRMSAP